MTTAMNWVRIGAILGAIAVGCGSFGAHGLTPTPDAFKALSPPDQEATTRRLANFETAVRYNMYHALAIVAVGAILATRTRSSRPLVAAGWLFLAGVLIFSGTLYAIGVGGPRSLGMITPFGGVALILGWIVLAFGLKSFGAADPIP